MQNSVDGWADAEAFYGVGKIVFDFETLSFREADQER